MAANKHNLGDLVRVTGTLKVQSTGLVTDPTAMKLTVKKPSGAPVTYVYQTDAIIVKDSTGVYHADLDANEEGDWYYRWWSTGSGQAAEEKYFNVRETQTA